MWERGLGHFIHVFLIRKRVATSRHLGFSSSLTAPLPPQVLGSRPDDGEHCVVRYELLPKQTPPFVGQVLPRPCACVVNGRVRRVVVRRRVSESKVDRVMAGRGDGWRRVGEGWLMNDQRQTREKRMSDLSLCIYILGRSTTPPLRPTPYASSSFSFSYSNRAWRQAESGRGLGDRTPPPTTWLGKEMLPRECGGGSGGARGVGGEGRGTIGTGTNELWALNLIPDLGGR